MRSLYKDMLPAADRSLRKTAAFAGRLSETPENWPQELTSDLFKQLPFLSDYDVNVNLDKVDGERGYAFGYADVHNKTERPEQEHDESGLPHLRVPLVVKERSVKPFSVFMDGEKVMPLNEERVRESLFNPATFDLSVQPPSDPSLVEPLMPPHRSGIGMGGDYKLASVDDQLLAMLQGKTKTATNAIGTPPLPQVTMPKVGARTGLSSPGMGSIAKPTPGALPKTNTASVKLAFKHISKEQWDAIYQAMPVQQALIDYGGDRTHPAVQNKVYEIAVQQYGFHPKPEPPPPQKLQEMHQKHHEKKMQMAEKATQKAKIQQIKKASADSLLLAIAPTVREKDRDAFFNKIASSPTLLAGLKRSGIGPVLAEFAETKLASSDDMLRAVAENIDPTVITLQKLPGGDFLVKSASNEAFAPDQAAQGQVVPQEEAAGAIGQEQAQAMQPGQTATAVADPIQSAQGAGETNADVISQFGEYLVQDMMGNQLMGWVFPTTMAWDGNFTEAPVALFTNGSAFAMQDGIAGELVGKSVQLPMGTPRNEGVFYEVTRDGARATAPVTVRSGMSGPDGSPKYQCVDFMGNQFTVGMSPELVQPQRIADNEYAIPASWKFMTIMNQTQLVPDPLQLNKTSAVKTAARSVDLFWNGAFNLEGGCGLNKIARDFRYDLDAVSAEFMLGLLGVPGHEIKEKLSSARKNGVVKLAGLKTITTLAERYEGKQKTAQTLALRVPNLRRDLLKEAAALEDESTVDKVLALNFVNPENLSTFIAYIPELEQTSEKLAEMLLSSYLGMEQVPEGAVERAMKNMEETVLALKAVQHAES